MEENRIIQEDYDLLFQLFSMREPALVKGLGHILENYFQKIYKTHEYIYAIGDIPITLIAHLDTVHYAPVTQLFHDQERGVLWSPQGLGADDRAGVFAILKLIEEGYRPSVIFCTQEEKGGIGASAFIKAFAKPETKTNFLIELDRQGEEDSVYYSFDNIKFEDYINEYGFVTDWGTFTDISTISPAWQVPAVNLSIGYFNEHTKGEYLDYKIMYSTIEKVKKILEAEAAADHIFEYKELEYWNNPRYADIWYRTTPINTNSKDCDFNICTMCETPHKKTESIILKDFGTDFCFCKDCQEEYVRKCINCGKAFIDWSGSQGYVCEECERRL